MILFAVRRVRTATKQREVIVLQEIRYFWLDASGDKLSSQAVQLFSAVGRNFDSIELAAAVQQSQTWLRAPGTERWQQPKIEADETVLWDVIKRLGMFEPVMPTRRRYDAIVLLGATYPSMAIRLKAINDSGVSCDRLVAITGVRPLNEAEQKIFNEKGVDPSWKTERDAAILLFGQRSLPEARVVSVVAAANKPDGKRATTEETVVALAGDINPGSSLLFVSHQPFGLRQSLTVSRALGAKAEQLEIDFCFGPALPKPMSEMAATILDESCRLLYELGEAAKR